MLRIFFCLLLCLQCVWSQNPPKDDYREDQIFVGISYPFLVNAAPEVTQNKFSHALQAGFVRDMPLNTQRNLALGLGLGFSYNVLYNNLRFLEESESFELIPNEDTNLWKWTELNLPVELRWRTSSSELYKFWRIYGGVTAIYTLNARQNYRKDDATSRFSDLSLDKFRLALHFSVGNNTWNIYFQQSLAPMFKTPQITENDLIKDLGNAKIGLIFYVF